MEATYSRRGRRRRRRRGTGRRLLQILRTILLWHVLPSVSRTWCLLAYTTSQATRITSAKETFCFRSTRRGVLVLGRTGALRRRCSRTATIANRMTADGESDKIGIQTKTAMSGVTNAGVLDAYDGRYSFDDWLFDDRKQRVAFYGILAVLETIFWYCGAPGIDSQSRWFNPLDGELIASLLDPSTVLSPPVGSGLGFSSLLLNTFLILPMVWSLLLLQERDIVTNDDSSGHKINNTIPHRISKSIAAAFRAFACAGGFLVGGGILIPYMIFRRPMAFRRSIDPEKFPATLGLFEKACQPPTSTSELISTNPAVFPAPKGQFMLLALTSVVLISFLFPFASHHCDWNIEWNAFSDRAQSSQFTALALYDFTMISIAVLDPMMDDALRRGYVVGWDENCNDRVCVSSTTPESTAKINNNCYCNDDDNDNDDYDANRDGWRSGKRNDALRRLAPFVAIPLIGPVAWILIRPRYGLVAGE